MVVPLRDQNGRVRYYLGAQLDITELVNACTGLESLQRLIDRQSVAPGQRNEDEVKVQLDQMAEFQQLSETFSNQELQSLLGSQERKQLDDQVSHGLDAYQAQPVRHKNPSASLDSSSRLPGIGSAPPLGFYKNVSDPLCKSGVVRAEKCSIYLFDRTLHSVSSLLRQICGFLVSCSRRSWSRLEEVRGFAMTCITPWRQVRKSLRKFDGYQNHSKRGELGGSIARLS